MTPGIASNRSASRVVCYTSFTYSYLSRAVILVRTLRMAHPDWAIWAVVVDEAPPGVEVSAHLAEFDHVVPADTLGIKDFQPWIFKHDVIEACTAVKGRMMLHLFDHGFEKVVYLDPDIGVFHPLAAIEPKLEIYSIILTPHQVEANNTQMAINDNEMTSFQYGIYNLGFIGVRNDDVGRAFAAWWDSMLYKSCYEEVESGIYTDQKYCDIVPALFDRVHIERDPGYNVASWNISRRRVRISAAGDILVNGSPLKFYHFTKIGGAGDVMTERYSGDNFEITEIWSWYKRQVSGSVFPSIPKSYWSYGTFSNGTPITQAARIVYRTRFDTLGAQANPFDVAGDSFYRWLLREAPDALPPASHTSPMDSMVPVATGTPDDDGEECHLFDESWYLIAYADVAEAVRDGRFRNGREHYVQEGRSGRRMPHHVEVDEAFYLATYADVSEAVAKGIYSSAEEHFYRCGYHEGRRPYSDSTRSTS